MSTIVDVDEAPRPAIDPRLRQRRIDVRREEGRRRLRRLLIGVGVAAALALVWAFTYSSFLDVDHIVVSGQAHATETEVRAAANIGRGQPMVYLDTEGAARRVEALPWVASASVRRSYPDTVRIDVVERVPVVAEPLKAGGFRLIDGEGHAIADTPALPSGVVVMTGPTPPVAVGAVVDTQQLAAIDAAAVLPTLLRQRVGAVTWDADGSVALELAPQGTIRIGPPTNLPAKYLAAIAVLEKLDPKTAIGVLDVRAPEAPVLAPG
jgi:cell division protein FtsQ